MLKGKWLRYVVIGGIAALLVVIGLSIYQAPRCFPLSGYFLPKIGSADKEYDAAAKEAAAWATAIQNDGMPQIPCPDGIKDCAQSYHDALDLKAQWAAAKAALDMACLSIYQFIIGLAGLFGLIATIVYTHRTFRLTAKTAEQQLRAYIHVEKVTFENIKFAEFPECYIRIQNFGQTPARKVVWKSGIGYGKSPPDINFTEFDEGDWGENVIGPNDGFRMNSRCADTLGGDEIRALENEEAYIWVWGRIDYVDAFNEPRQTTYCIHNCANFSDPQAYTTGNDAK